MARGRKKSAQGEPRQRKPFFKKSHDCWYVHQDGKMVRLAKDRDEAFRKWEDLRLQRRLEEEGRAEREAAGITLVNMAQEFFTMHFRGKSEKTLQFHKEKIVPLCRELGADFLAASLTVLHINEWIAKHPAWSTGTARTVWQAVKALCSWGYVNERIPRLRLLEHRKPAANRREVVISPEEYERIRAAVVSEEFKALLDMAWETGARPQELWKMQVSHCDFERKLIVFKASESKGKKRPRVIFLEPGNGLEIAQRQAELYGTGHLFRNTEGNPWTPGTSNLAFQRLRRKIAAERMPEPTEKDITTFLAKVSPTVKEAGVERLKTEAERIAQAKLKFRASAAKKLAPKYCLYHFRHSWLDRRIKQGVGIFEAAKLMGHADASMIIRHYEHLSQSPEFLRAALMKATGGGNP
jgi:integrase